MCTCAFVNTAMEITWSKRVANRTEQFLTVLEIRSSDCSVGKLQSSSWAWRWPSFPVSFLGLSSVWSLLQYLFLSHKDTHHVWWRSSFCLNPIFRGPVWEPRHMGSGQMKFGAWVQALVVHGEDQTKELEDVGTVPSCWTHEVCFSSFTCFLWTCETCLYKWGGQRLTFLHVCVCTWLCIVGNAVQLRMCIHVDVICQCGYLWLLALFWGPGPLTELWACLATW